MTSAEKPHDLNRLWQWALHEDNLLHSRLAVFLTAHALLLAAVGFLIDSEDSPVRFSFLVAALGLALGFFWLVIQMRSRQILENLEGKLKADPLFLDVIGGLNKRIPISQSMILTVALPSLVALFWVFLVVALAWKWI